MEYNRFNAGPARISWPHLFEPNPKSERKAYDVCLMIPKSDKDAVALIKKAMAAAVPEKYVKDKKVAPGFRLPLRDGDLERADSPGYEGMYFINAKTMYKPKCVKKVAGEFIDATAEDIYPGCWVYANIHFFPYEESGNRGLSCSLNAVVKYRDDKSFGGSAVDAGTVFADIQIPDDTTLPAAAGVDDDDLPF